jgi:hypothetical protein
LRSCWRLVQTDGRQRESPNCAGISAAAAGVFQWRLCERDSVRSEAHIVELVRALQTTGSPFDPLLVFPAGDKYFAIDGHHRLTAYEAAQWNEPVHVEVFKGSFKFPPTAPSRPCRSAQWGNQQSGRRAT